MPALCSDPTTHHEGLLGTRENQQEVQDEELSEGDLHNKTKWMCSSAAEDFFTFAFRMKFNFN